VRTLWLGGIILLSLALSGLLWADEDLEKARQQATQRLADAEAAAVAAGELTGHADYGTITRRDDEIPELLRRAQGLLGSARQALRGAEQRPSQTAFQDAGILARGAGRAFGDFEKRVQRMLRKLEAERRPPPPPAPPPPPPPTPPPSQLRQAAEAFLGGQYQQTVTLLAEMRFSTPKALAHGHLLRAAARYAIFLWEGEKDYALRGEAIADVLACRQADPTVVPEESLFSPRFREFFAAAQ
jgi:hypothetical protein